MRKACVFLFLAALGAVMVIGCEKDNLVPYLTRVMSSGTCGVAPYQVEFLAVASGGNPLKEPTGANLYLDIVWNFGDGASATGSVAYHTYAVPGTYEVTVNVTDDDGESPPEPSRLTVVVRDDSLAIRAFATTDDDTITATTTCDEIKFGVKTWACGFDAETGDYSRYVFRWMMDDLARTVHRGQSPVHTYAANDTGLHRVILRLEDISRSITRLDTVYVRIEEAYADLGLALVLDQTGPSPGDTINFTITLDNAGPTGERGVLVTDRLPDGLTFLAATASQGEYDPGTGIWAAGDLASGEMAELVLTATVDAETIGLLSNVAAITEASRCDPVAGNNQHTVNFTVFP